MIQLYNTLTRTKEPFIPLVSGQVSIYVCGPTVYNYIHIGNARSAIAFDTIRRYFEYRGFAVNYVSNFTDVDDKIIHAGQTLGLTPGEVAEKFIAAFKEDAAALNIQPATTNPQVTEFIPQIIAFIQDLIEKGFAYESFGDVYFRTRKFKNYGQLSGKKIDELEIGASQRTGQEQERKEDPIDFALWKAVKPGEIFWEAPFGPGRPGWHIECSVMATQLLGPTIDIHGGGQDLEFPHHENEIAQSESETGQKFANYWMHNAFVTVGSDDEKMSKSLGNFVTVHDLLHTVDGQVVRFLMATTQYRRPIRFSKESLAEAKNNLTKIQTAFDNASFLLTKDIAETNNLDGENLLSIDQFEKQFQVAMDDDFNAANGLTAVYDFVRWLNSYSETEEISRLVLNESLTSLTKIVSVFGLDLAPTQTESLDHEIDDLIEQRNAARDAKDFAKSDAIRDQLKAQGIVLEDTPQGTRWRKINE
ncbi:cysteine--tRNA ligase [Enterococcus timonensis]|uniref:cysteine--tRNA ligase n=1 Tax=Enterococcus timonensis TaxID=1852364 RepID=UPI0008DA0D08|nr:cysteine--tRNA ligase [Enterococcus timonensis]